MAWRAVIYECCQEIERKSKTNFDDSCETVLFKLFINGSLCINIARGPRRFAVLCPFHTPYSTGRKLSPESKLIFNSLNITILVTYCILSDCPVNMGYI